MTLKAIFCDLGNVLVHFSHQKMYENLAHFSGQPLAAIVKFLREKGWGAKYERGEVDTQQLHAAFCELSERALPFAGLLEAVGNIFALKEDTLSIVEQLSAQEVPLYILSNTCEAHIYYLQRHFPRLFAPFQGAILSYEVKLCKPEKEIYQAALQLAQCRPEETFYMDDILEYVTAAQSLGIQSHHFQGADQAKSALQQLGFELI